MYRKALYWDLLAGIIPLLAGLPLLIMQLDSFRSRPPLWYAFLVWFLVFFLTWRMGKGPLTQHPRRIRIAVLAILLGSSLAVMATFYFSPWAMQLAAIVVFFAWALGRLGGTPWTTVGAWTGILFTSLPIPGAAYSQFLQTLDHLVAWFCSRTLDALEIPHFLNGGVCEFDGWTLAANELTVEWLSPFLLISLIAVSSLLFKRSFSHCLLWITAGLWWTLVLRYVGEMTVVLTQQWYDWEWNQAKFWVAVAVFVLTLVCTLLSDRLLLALLQPVVITDPEATPVFVAINEIFCWPNGNPLDDIPPDDPEELNLFKAIKAALNERRNAWQPLAWYEKTWLRLPVFATVVLWMLVGLPGAVVVMRTGFRPDQNPLPVIDADDLNEIVHEDFLPSQFGDLKRVGYVAALVEDKSLATAHWSYQWKAQIVTCNLIFPHRGWNPRVVTDPAAEVRSEIRGSQDADWPWLRMREINSLGGQIYQFECAIGDDLSEVKPPEKEAIEASTLDWPLFQRLGISGIADEEQPLCYYFLVSCESGGSLSPEEQLELEGQFRKLRSHLQTQLPANRLAQNLQ
ncbi:MAG: exosortase/archaeosortase family protein [Planctomycetales bacterium]|nr:exosortase/archaeosortase family protein [Planctomycetales bacterium]